MSSIVLSSGINESCRRCIQGLDVSMSLPSSFFFFPTLTHLCFSVCVCLSLHLSLYASVFTSLYLSISVLKSLSYLSLSLNAYLFVSFSFLSLSILYHFPLCLPHIFFMRTTSSKRQFIFWTSYFRSKLSQAMPMEW